MPHANVAAIPAALLLNDLLESGYVTTDSGQRLELNSHIPREVGMMLQEIIRELDARTTLEIGLAFGISALFMCEALAERVDAGARHIIADPFQRGPDWQGVGLRHLHLAGFDHLIDFRELPTHQALADLEREGVRIDFALIDGFHTFDYVMMDALLVDRLLRVGGMMVVDDTDWPGVRKACRYFITNRGYRVIRTWSERPEMEHLPLVRKAISAAARRSPAIGERLKPEWAVRDDDLGLPPNCRCVAMVKTREDDRLCFEHEPF